MSIRMLPWTPRWRWPWPRRTRGEEAAADRGGWESLGEVFVADEWIVLAIFAVVIGILFVLPLFIFFVEVLIVVALVVGTAVARILLRQPWILDAVAEDGTHLSWKVVGYLRSRQVVQDVRLQLQRGIREPRPADAVLVR